MLQHRVPLLQTSDWIRCYPQSGYWIWVQFTWQRFTCIVVSSVSVLKQRSISGAWMRNSTDWLKFDLLALAKRLSNLYDLVSWSLTPMKREAVRSSQREQQQAVWHSARSLVHRVYPARNHDGKTSMPWCEGCVRAGLLLQSIDSRKTCCSFTLYSLDSEPLPQPLGLDTWCCSCESIRKIDWSGHALIDGLRRQPGSSLGDFASLFSRLSIKGMGNSPPAMVKNGRKWRRIHQFL